MHEIVNRKLVISLFLHNIYLQLYRFWDTLYNCYHCILLLLFLTQCMQITDIGGGDLWKSNTQKQNVKRDELTERIHQFIPKYHVMKNIKIDNICLLFPSIHLMKCIRIVKCKISYRIFFLILLPVRVKLLAARGWLAI